MSQIKKIIFSGIIAVIVLTGILFFVFNNDDTKQKGCMRSFLNTYYSNENNEIRPPSNDPEEEKKFIENIDSLYQSLYQEKYSDMLTYKAFETLSTTRYLFYPLKIIEEFKCTLKFTNVEIKRLSDTFDGNPAFSFEANIKVVFPDGSARDFLETGSFNLVKEKNKWLIDTFYSRRELYSEIKKIYPGQ